ncbi:MAG: hypothetical protein ABI672_16560 [Vicinamibacteria bacterium]
MNGTGPYPAEAGTIVGTTVMNSPNSFLGTTEEFGDFKLQDHGNRVSFRSIKIRELK